MICGTCNRRLDVMTVAEQVQHLSEHIAELAKRASPRYECPIHPGVGYSVLGMYRVVTCITCHRELEAIPV